MPSFNHIEDKHAAATCSKAGVATMRGRLMKLDQLEKALQLNIDEAKSAATWAEVGRYALFAVQIVKAACDATVTILGETTGPVGKLYATIYAGVDPSAKAVGKTLAGQSVGAAGWTQAGLGMVNAVAAKTVSSSDVQDVIKLKTIQTDLIVAAVNSDGERLKKDLVDHGVKLSTMAAKVAGRKALGQALTNGKQLVASGQDMLKAHGEFAKGGAAGGIEAATKTSLALQIKLRQSIASLMAAIESCELELAPKKHKA